MFGNHRAACAGRGVIRFPTQYLDMTPSTDWNPVDASVTGGGPTSDGPAVEDLVLVSNREPYRHTVDSEGDGEREVSVTVVAGDGQTDTAAVSVDASTVDTNPNAQYFGLEFASLGGSNVNVDSIGSPSSKSVSGISFAKSLPTGTIGRR